MLIMRTPIRKAYRKPARASLYLHNPAARAPNKVLPCLPSWRAGTNLYTGLVRRNRARRSPARHGDKGRAGLRKCSAPDRLPRRLSAKLGGF
jgi:hypothetical protein